MRRALAIVLVAIFSLPLIAPAFASSPDDSRLPACCRRGGKHHCAMAMEMGNIPSRFRVVSEKCPFLPFGHSPFLQAHALAILSSPSIRHAAGPAAIVRAVQTGYRISADRTRHKRGPPHLS